MRWAHNGVTYLLKGKKYWRVDGRKIPTVGGQDCLIALFFPNVDVTVKMEKEGPPGNLKA